MVVLEGALTRNRARCRRIHRRMIARLCRAHALLCLLYCIDRRRTIRAVEQPVVRAVIQRERIARIAQLIVDRERRIRRYTDHIVQRCHSDLIVVSRCRQILLRIRQLHLRGEHIRPRHRTHTELRVHIREMRLQRRHRILAHLHQIACLQDIEIIRRRRQADRLLRLLERKVRRVQPVARRFPLCLQRRVIDRHRDRARIAVVIVILNTRLARALIRLATDAVCRRRPRERRSHRAVRLRERGVRRIHIRQRLLDRAVILERHLHAAREIHLHRRRRCSPCEKPNSRSQRKCPYKAPRKTSPIFQHHFLLVRYQDTPERRAAPYIINAMKLY